MNKSILNRLAILGGCFAILMTAFAVNTAAQGFFTTPPKNSNDTVKTDIAPVHVFGSTVIIPQAGASLSKNNESAFATISTSGLTPGHVVTLWWAIFNNPEYCATPGCSASDLNNPWVQGSTQYGGGLIVGAGGRADFSGYLATRDNTGFEILPPFPNMPNPSPGIVSTKKATIHLIIRTHGAANADPAILSQQLTKFGGGCAVSVPTPCANIQAALFFP